MDKPQLTINWTDFVHHVIDLVLPRSDDILTSPSKIGELLSLCAELAAIEPIVRDTATTLAMQKCEILGWTLVHRDGNRYVEASDVRDLLLECPANQLPALLEALTKALGSISESKWRTLCQAIGRIDAEGSIAQAGATVFLRRNAQSQTPERNNHHARI